nr:coiled-coil domain-containing protein 12 isoform X1 [Macaca nemestrina]
MQDERKGGASAGKMEATTAGVGRLEEEALRRKERLKALREKTGRKDKEDGEPRTKHLREEEEEGEKHRELRLRNYVPEDEDLKKRRVPQAKPVAVEEKVKEQLEAAKPEPVIEEVVSAWAALASSLLLCVLFLFATCSPSAPHSFSSLLFPSHLPLCPRPSPSSFSFSHFPPSRACPPPSLGRPLHPDMCLFPSQDLANLAPRKPDWDLKRDVAKKLEKLKKRTQRAIAELIRERLKGQDDSLASAVDAATEQKACDSD